MKLIATLMLAAAFVLPAAAQDIAYTSQEFA